MHWPMYTNRHLDMVRSVDQLKIELACLLEESVHQSYDHQPADKCFSVDSRISTCREILGSFKSATDVCPDPELVVWISLELIEIREASLSVISDDISSEVENLRSEFASLSANRPLPVPLEETTTAKNCTLTDNRDGRLAEWQHQRRVSKRLELRAFETQLLEQYRQDRQAVQASRLRRQLKHQHRKEKALSASVEQRENMKSSARARKERREFFINSGAHDRVEQSAQRMERKRHPNTFKDKQVSGPPKNESAIEPILRRFKAINEKSRLKVL